MNFLGVLAAFWNSDKKGEKKIMFENSDISKHG